MIFQASDLKKQHFLDLCDKENNFLELTYAKGRSWLKLFGYSNFPREDFSCLYGSYPIKSRHYILHECKRFNMY